MYTGISINCELNELIIVLNISFDTELRSVVVVQLKRRTIIPNGVKLEVNCLDN